MTYKKDFDHGSKKFVLQMEINKDHRKLTVHHGDTTDYEARVRGRIREYRKESSRKGETLEIFVYVSSRGQFFLSLLQEFGTLGITYVMGHTMGMHVLDDAGSLRAEFREVIGTRIAWVAMEHSMTSRFWNQIQASLTQGYALEHVITADADGFATAMRCKNPLWRGW